MDLCSLLLFDHLEEAASRSPNEADFARQRLEPFLSTGGERSENEARAISAYLELSFDDKLDLSPSVHEWALERIAEMPQFDAPERTAEKVAEAFFVRSDPALQLLCVNALLAIGERIDLADVSSTDLIGLSALHQEEPGVYLDALSDTLLDLHFLSPKRGPALRALRRLVTMTAEAWQLPAAVEFGEKLRSRVRQRAEWLSPELAGELESLFGSGETRTR